MTGYQIVFKSKEVAGLESFTVREPGENDVVVRVKYNLISAGTEKAQLAGGNNTKNKFPVNIGYSSVGYVESVGKSVKSIGGGDRVFVAYGGHANYNVKHFSSVFKIPDNVSLEEAVFTRIASFPLAALRRSRLEIGESVVIVGLGMLGLLGVQLARIGGAMPCIAVGNRELRRQKAAEFGADYVLEPNDPELVKKILDITEQKTQVRGANVVVETSGSESGLQEGLKYAAKHARVMLNGCQREMKEPLDLYKYIHLKGVNMVGVHDMTRPPYNSIPGNWTPKRDYITILGLLADGRLNTKDLISEYVSPHNAYEVYQRLLYDREFPLGVLFDWDKL